ncbi:MAG: TolC family protein [Planctomycetota bacterium]|nr:TolC family protein [Planctomycetota bacterium]
MSTRVDAILAEDIANNQVRASQALSTVPDPSTLTGPLDLQQTLALVALHHPALASIAYAQRATEAEVFQAGRLRNPEIEFEVEEFGGSGENSGFDAAVYTLRLGQVLELGGDRGARRDRAVSAARLAARDTEATKVAIYTQCTLVFIDLLEAQKEAVIAREAKRITQDLVEAARVRVANGAATELELLRAQAHLAQATVEARSAERQVSSRRSDLAGMWGAQGAAFSEAIGPFDDIAGAVPLDAVLAAVDGTPAVARWADEMTERLAAIQMERAARVPDLAVMAGVEHASADDETTFLMGLGIELPVFDRNSGAIQAASYRAMQAERDRDTARLETRSAVVGLWHAWMAARERAMSLAEQVLPSLEAAKAAADTAFRSGKIDYLDVLSIQEDYLAGRIAITTARAEAHRAQAALEGLLARPLTSLNWGPDQVPVEEQP